MILPGEEGKQKLSQRRTKNKNSLKCEQPNDRFLNSKLSQMEVFLLDFAQLLKNVKYS